MSEYDNFDRTMRELIKVPHSEIKDALDAEKAAKKPRPGKAKVKPGDGRNKNND